MILCMLSSGWVVISIHLVRIDFPSSQLVVHGFSIFPICTL